MLGTYNVLFRFEVNMKKKKEKDFNKSLLAIFLSYFGAHKKLFFIDMSCAFIVAMIDIAFPLVSRFAMYELLPGKLYKVFFTLMIITAITFCLRAVFQYIITFFGHIFGIRVEADIRNEKIGKKLFITGKGRCNVTNACEVEELFNNVLEHSKFLYSAIYSFDTSIFTNFSAYSRTRGFA